MWAFFRGHSQFIDYTIYWPPLKTVIGETNAYRLALLLFAPGLLENFKPDQVWGKVIPRRAAEDHLVLLALIKTIDLDHHAARLIPIAP